MAGLVFTSAAGHSLPWRIPAFSLTNDPYASAGQDCPVQHGSCLPMLLLIVAEVGVLPSTRSSGWSAVVLVEEFSSRFPFHTSDGVPVVSTGLDSLQP